jgi:hypothetical protein
MLSRSAVEVVSSMPDFIPVQNDGKDVSVQFTVPIRYAVK